MMSDVTIVEFLRARLDEDEAVAQAAIVGSGIWVGEVNRDNDDHPEEITEAVVMDATDSLMDRFFEVVTFQRHRPLLAVGDNVSDVSQWVNGPPEGPTGQPQVEHIARHDPARVLREVEAKRDVIAFAQHLPYTYGRGVLEPMSRAYSDHPDYRDEWR